MRGILINPFDRTVAVLDYDPDYKAMKELLGVGDSPLTIVRVDREHLMYLDDEGLLKAGQRFFLADFYPSQPLAGKGLIVREKPYEDDETQSQADVIMGLSDLSGRIHWLADDLRVESIETHTEENVDTAFGKVTRVTNRPVFTRGKDSG